MEVDGKNEVLPNEDIKNETKETNLRNFEQTFISDWKKALKRVEEGRKCCEHLSRIFLEIIRIEKEYEYSLRNLSVLFKEFKNESSGIKNGIISLKKNIERRCEQIKDFINYIECEILNNTLNTTLLNHKNVFDQIKIDGIENDKEVEKTRNESVRYIENCVDAYETLMEAINIFHNSTYYHPLKRIELSNTCIHKYLIAKKREYEYKNTINNVNEVELKKEKRLKSILHSLESMDSKRISCIKDNIMKYLIFFTSYIRNVQYDLNSCIDTFKDVDASREIEEYCELHYKDIKTESEHLIFYNNIVSWPMLIDYLNEVSSMEKNYSYNNTSEEISTLNSSNHVTNTRSKYTDLISSFFNANLYKNFLQNDDNNSTKKKNVKNSNNLYTNIFNEIVFFNKKEENDQEVSSSSDSEEETHEGNLKLRRGRNEVTEPMVERKEGEVLSEKAELMSKTEFSNGGDKQCKKCKDKEDKEDNEGKENKGSRDDKEGKADKGSRDDKEGKADNGGKEDTEGKEDKGGNEAKDEEGSAVIKQELPNEINTCANEAMDNGGKDNSLEHMEVEADYDSRCSNMSVRLDCVEGSNCEGRNNEGGEKKMDDNGKINKEITNLEKIKNVVDGMYKNSTNKKSENSSDEGESDFSCSYVRNMVIKKGWDDENDSDSVSSDENCPKNLKKMEIFFKFYLKNLFHNNFDKISKLNITRYFNVYNNRFIFCECLIYFIKKKRVHFTHIKSIVIFAKIILSFLDLCNLYLDYWSSIYILVASENFYFEIEKNRDININILLEQYPFFEKGRKKLALNRSIKKTKSKKNTKNSYGDMCKNGDFFFSDDSEHCKTHSSKGNSMEIFSKTKRESNVINIYECRKKEVSNGSIKLAVNGGDVVTSLDMSKRNNDTKEEGTYEEDDKYCLNGLPALVNTSKDVYAVNINNSEYQVEEEKIRSKKEESTSYGIGEIDMNINGNVTTEKNNTNAISTSESIINENNLKMKKVFLHKFLYAHDLWNNIKFWEVSLLIIISEIIQENVLLEKLRYENKESLIKKYFFFFKYFNFYNSMIDFGLSVNQIGLLLNKIFHAFNLKNDPISRKYFFQIIDIATNKNITLNYIKMDSNNMNNEYKKYYLQYYNNFLNDDTKSDERKQ
ncbi:hypothetical protein MKS88_002650 [Plasmodium brasilianum]|uniref:Uncharacterized protein n=2 Tax=Plasmodium (Plasmodium) TaxID=418103 RepID=A0A1A8VWX6_PLAMA|nr:conserved Plasmodium protein, unknown function [Plasmodium malariae]KAI4838177.1 hypothetical protein MKS88_002650 [Plasmodium brasilianum]SBS85086.1 conserved Plasmodium protein, unknown function [Plasmodium malariae]SCN12572.1 conserved Plasmodium protein, unknown function [Plasmodium malariae]